ncbi:MAG: putative type VI secretion system effector [Pseudomonadota bacterium]
MNKKLALLTGTLSDLQTGNDEENFVSSGGAEMAAGSAAIGLAAAGLAGAATNSLIAASGATDSVQSFTGIVNGKRISGRFSKIWFKDGDHLECAVDLQNDGSYAVYAVRRPSDQTLWMFPHCSRGRKKHWKYASKMCVILALITTTFLLLVLMPHYGIALWANEKSYHAVTVFSIMGVVMGFYFSLKTAFRWTPFVVMAESIFTAFGYPDPAHVDMPEQDRAFWKKQPSAVSEGSAPWVFRYII